MIVLDSRETLIDKNHRSFLQIAVILPSIRNIINDTWTIKIIFAFDSDRRFSFRSSWIQLFYTTKANRWAEESYRSAFIRYSPLLMSL